MFISSLQRGCQPCFSFAERNNLRLFFPSSSCFSCSAPKLSLLRNFSLAENMRILFFFAYCLYSLLFVFLKEDCFLSGFVENWRFSVDVWQQELWAFGLRQRSRLTLRWSEENWVGWEQWRRRRRAFIPRPNRWCEDEELNGIKRENGRAFIPILARLLWRGGGGDAMSG